jgi:hypothetical protein
MFLLQYVFVALRFCGEGRVEAADALYIRGLRRRMPPLMMLVALCFILRCSF